MLRHGAREQGGTVVIVHVRLQAILASLVMLPNSLFRRGRGLLWPVEDRSGLWQHYLLFWHQHDC
jgi:hypothetical protein